MTHDTEQNLVAKARSGNDEAFGRLTEMNSGQLRGYLVAKLDDPDDANDLLQAIWLKVWRNLANYEERGQFQAWVWQIARHELLNFLKRRKRNQFVSEEAKLLSFPDAKSSPDKRLADKERFRQLWTCIAKLPPDEHRLVLRRLTDDVTFREIAESSAIPLNTVLGRMHSARRRLRASLPREC